MASTGFQSRVDRTFERATLVAAQQLRSTESHAPEESVSPHGMERKTLSSIWSDGDSQGSRAGTRPVVAERRNARNRRIGR